MIGKDIDVGGVYLAKVFGTMTRVLVVGKEERFKGDRFIERWICLDLDIHMEIQLKDSQIKRREDPLETLRNFP